ncbi:hypothetical protein P7K49_012448, partial [Saguinus oedipus]
MGQTQYTIHPACACRCHDQVAKRPGFVGSRGLSESGDCQQEVSHDGQTTALDKERQVFRRRRNQDVRSRYKAQPAPPELNSESEDYSPSSSET